MISRLLRYLTFGLSLAGMVLITLVIRQIRGQVREVPPPPVAPPPKPFDGAVAATGLLEAMDENVSVGVPVPGLITAVEVRVNQEVKAGDPLLRMDDRELQAQMAGQRAQVDLARARIAVQQAMVEKMQDIYDRVRRVDAKAVSADEVQQRENDLKVGRAQLAAAEAELAAALAEVRRTEMLIDRLVVRAPRAGTILQVNVRGGEYASAAPKLPPLVLGNIGAPGRREFHVRADVDEQSATRIREGRLRRGTATVKGDAAARFDLAFVRVEPLVVPKTSLTGVSTERVDTRVLQVIFRLRHDPAKDPPLYVGQQMDVFIDTGGGGG